MARLMAWRSLSGSEDEEKILHIKEGEKWVPYFRSCYKVPDYKVPGGSKGYATMQALLKQGWVFESAVVKSLVK